MTHYDVLKVARDAPPEVLRAAYKAMSQKHHPDRNAGTKDSNESMTLINAAFSILNDPVKRKTYDDWLALQDSAAKVRRPASPSMSGSKHRDQPLYDRLLEYLTNRSPITSDQLEKCRRTIERGRLRFMLVTAAITFSFAVISSLFFGISNIASDLVFFTFIWLALDTFYWDVINKRVQDMHTARVRRP